MSSSSATLSSSTSNSSCSNNYSGAAPPYRHRSPSIRKIVLKRSASSSELGFTIRGGVEHGLGHYVSGVDPGGEAHARGLRIGDQILSVCGLPLIRTTHKEVVGLISGRRKVELEVKSVGLIPCKIRKGDPITWKSVVDIHYPDKSAVPIIVDLLQSEGTLGCSICKGPPDRPGVFVQSISNNGIAWKSGLRMGDQILSCNGVEFKDHDDFSRVIRVMKSSKLLTLFVRKNAGKDFLSTSSSAGGTLGNDSSGYDSTEEKPVLKEEVLEPKDEELEALKQERQRLELLQKEREEIQRLKDERNELERLRRLESIRIEREKLTLEQEKLKIQAESLAKEKEKFEMEKQQNQMKVSREPPTAAIVGHSSSSAVGVPTGSDGSAQTSTLMSAIQSEIHRRTLRKSTTPKGPPPPLPPHKKKESVITSLQNENHDKLIEEFRSVHRKMFSQKQAQNAGESSKIRDLSEEDAGLDVIEYTDSDDITVPNFLTDESSSSGGEESKGTTPYANPSKNGHYPLRQKNSVSSSSGSSCPDIPEPDYFEEERTGEEIENLSKVRFRCPSKSNTKRVYYDDKSNRVVIDISKEPSEIRGAARQFNFHPSSSSGSSTSGSETRHVRFRLDEDHPPREKESCGRLASKDYRALNNNVGGDKRRALPPGIPPPPPPPPPPPTANNCRHHKRLL